MNRVGIIVYFWAALSLAFGVIWPASATAAVTALPQVQPLGQIKAGLRVPARLAVDAAGNLYVADSRNLQVVVYNKYGQKTKIFNVPEMSGNGLAVSPDGNLIYISTRTQVLLLDATSSTMESFGSGAAEFVAVGFIAIDSNGSVYVADVGTGQIKVYSGAGKFQRLFGAFKFDNISSFAIDTQHDGLAATDEIYVADSLVSGAALPKLHVFNLSGSLLRTHQADGDFGAQSIRMFGGLAFDNAGRYYVADLEQNSLRVMARSDAVAMPGTLLLNFTDEHSLLKPKSMVFDSATSRLFVLYGDRQIQIYGIDGGTNPVPETYSLAAPVPVAPVAGSEVASLSPLLQFSYSGAAAGHKNVSYSVRLLDAAESLVSSFKVTEQTDISAAQVPVKLQENSLYRWQVQAHVGQQTSRWSELQTFYVNAQQQVPSQPQLLTPLNDAEVSSDPLLIWQGSSDPDPSDSLRYSLAVAADATFSANIISQELTDTQFSLSDYRMLLAPGGDYFWRVTAVDNHGLSSMASVPGRFSYQAAALKITANMPGARVYLGGQQNYAGQLLGEAPLELRDLQPGRYQLVVEHAGFEPFLQPVTIAKGVSTAVYAQLQPALIPATLTFAALPVAGLTQASSTTQAPLVADLDLDGVEDLLLTDANGRVHYYPGALRSGPEEFGGAYNQRQVVFTTEQQLGLPQLSGTALCLIDWNNDFQQDLLVGGVDGSVRLYLNQGDFSFSAEGQWLASVAGQAIPSVADIDQDGDKDLLVGSGTGELLLFSNIGSDLVPQLAAAQSLVTFADAAAPNFVDWDADGQRELLIAADGQLYRATFCDGVFCSLTLIETAGVPIERLNAVDLDRAGGKDLLVGTTAGQLLLATSAGDQYAAEFYLALEEKLLQIKVALADEHSELLPLVEQMSVLLGDKNLAELLSLSEELIFHLPETAAASATTAELAIMLQ